MTLQEASLLLYASFLLLTLYQAYRDYKKPFEDGEFSTEIIMTMFEIIAMIAEFVSITATVLCYALLLLFTIIDIFLHKEDD